MTANLDIEPEVLYVQISFALGSPPNFSGWVDMFDAKIESIVENMNATPSEATFWFPDARWNDDAGILTGDKVRILSAVSGAVVFEGFVTKELRQFSGGNEQGGKYERLAYSCLDYRWLLSVSTKIYGQFSRSKDDYSDAAMTNPLDNAQTGYSGRRCVFNAEGHPNKSFDDLQRDGVGYPIFGFNIETDDYWYAGDMLKYILSPLCILVNVYMPIDINNIEGLDHEDWNQYIGTISVEGLSVAAAMQAICKHIGWAYRIDLSDGVPKLVLFKPGSGTQHQLFAPAPSELKESASDSQIKQAVAADKKLLWSAQFDMDIENVNNWLIYLGSKQRVEFTAELVPGWLDSDLVPDESNSFANLFFTEAELAEMTTPNAHTFYRYYHSSGSLFKGDVGRIWVLNETGKYTGGDYDRGYPFDWGTVFPAKMGFDQSGNALYGPFARQLLPCLTANKYTRDSVGIKVEFSFDSGQTWHILPVGINSLSDRCGIIIVDPNLAEIKPKGELTITTPFGDSELEDEELNYWTSLCADKLDGNSFKLGEWNTRVRVTASVELDQRIYGTIQPLNSGSPFYQIDVFDCSGEFFHDARDDSSTFKTSDLPVYERDDSKKFKAYLEKLRDTLQDRSVSGQFTFGQLWFDFKIGDSIAKIDGRNFNLKTRIGSNTMAPEIVQIIHLPQKQQTKLITRDLRYSEKK